MLTKMKEISEAFLGKKATHEVRVEGESFFKDEDFSETPTRAKSEEQDMNLFKGTFKLVQKVLEDTDVTRKDIDEIVLVGSPT